MGEGRWLILVVLVGKRWSKENKMTFDPLSDLYGYTCNVNYESYAILLDIYNKDSVVRTELCVAGSVIFNPTSSWGNVGDIWEWWLQTRTMRQNPTPRSRMSNHSKTYPNQRACLISVHCCSIEKVYDLLTPNLIIITVCCGLHN